VTEPSSRDLHPQTGARFVFERIGSAPEPTYVLTIHLPEDRCWTGTLRWIDDRAQLEPAAEQLGPAGEPDELAWAHAEALKLARVLHRDPRPHMLRWRGRDANR
jgi:hypothetical protein